MNDVSEDSQTSAFIAIWLTFGLLYGYHNDYAVLVYSIWRVQPPITICMPLRSISGELLQKQAHGEAEPGVGIRPVPVINSVPSVALR
jgi:hypothetical protein